MKIYDFLDNGVFLIIIKKINTECHSILSNPPPPIPPTSPSILQSSKVSKLCLLTLSRTSPFYYAHSSLSRRFPFYYILTTPYLEYALSIICSQLPI